MSDQASETPLLELLRAVPPDARGEYEHSPTHHSFIPYGYYSQQAADTIESLQRENEELKRYVNEAERLFRMYGLSSPPRKGHEWPNTGGMGDE